MTTTNTCKTCGCQDSFMPSPAPCPTPVGCPIPQPCAEVIDAQCVVYTGEVLDCNDNVIIAANNNVAEAFNNIIDFFCAEITVASDIVCNEDIVVNQGTTVTNALINIVDYFCNNSGNNCDSLDWQNITLNFGATNPSPLPGYTFQEPQYAINTCTNQVYLRGTFFILQGEPDPAIAAAFTLPVGFRPINTRFYPDKVLPASGFDLLFGSVFIIITPNGDVIPSEVNGATANTLLIYSLDGIVFETN